MGDEPDIAKQSVDRAIMIFDSEAGKRVKQIAQELRQLIEGLIERYDPDSKPFKWRKREVKGAQIKHNI